MKAILRVRRRERKEEKGIELTAGVLRAGRTDCGKRRIWRRIADEVSAYHEAPETHRRRTRTTNVSGEGVPE